MLSDVTSFVILLATVVACSLGGNVLGKVVESSVTDEVSSSAVADVVASGSGRGGRGGGGLCGWW